LDDIARALNTVALEGHLAVARQIAARENPIALTNYTMLPTNLKQQGAPTDYPPLDPVAAWFGMAGINPPPSAGPSSKMGADTPTRPDTPSYPPATRQRLGAMKQIFAQLSAAEAKASQQPFDGIFRRR